VVEVVELVVLVGVVAALTDRLWPLPQPVSPSTASAAAARASVVRVARRRVIGGACGIRSWFYTPAARRASA
jgi:hypothetical protein